MNCSSVYSSMLVHASHGQYMYIRGKLLPGQQDYMYMYFRSQQLQIYRDGAPTPEFQADEKLHVDTSSHVDN